MANNSPTHRAYVVRERDDGDNFWTAVGACFTHDDGKGMTILADAWPSGDRLVIREIDAEEKANQKGKATRSKKKRAA